jgi:hypothetical protein
VIAGGYVFKQCVWVLVQSQATEAMEEKHAQAHRALVMSREQGQQFSVPPLSAAERAFLRERLQQNDISKYNPERDGPPQAAPTREKR